MFSDAITICGSIGEDIKLTCSSLRNINESISWTRNGMFSLSENMEISNNSEIDSRITVNFTTDNIYILSIYNLSWEDAGFYQCETNRNGSPNHTDFEVKITGICSGNGMFY